MEIKYIKTNQLNPYANNPRKNDKAVDKVAESIKLFGFKVPITIDKNNVVVTGHTRLKAAKKLGMAEVPCIMLDDLSDDQVKAFRIADNKVAEYAEWDLDALAIELKEIEMDLAVFDFKAPELAAVDLDEDDFEAVLPDKPKSKLGDIYQVGDHRVMCGDATSIDDMEDLMGDEQADLFLTDPPYNVDYEGMAGKIINDNQDSAQFYDFLVQAFTTANLFLKAGGVFYIWHSDSNGNAFRNACEQVRWQIRQCLIWVKNNLVLGRQDYQWKHEPCLYGWKDGAAHYFIDDRSYTTVIDDKINVNKLKAPEMKDLLKQLLDTRQATTVIYEDKPFKSMEHPTMKPLRLCGRLISNSTRPGDIILDTFGGSGSTLIAAEKLQRKCYMMELDPRYVDVIIKRYEELTGQKAIKISEGGAI